MHGAVQSLKSNLQEKDSVLVVFGPCYKICSHNIKKKNSLQSGGAILGPPGAPGAPVSIIIVVPEANPLH